ncbi:CotH kinase family protein [Candidatus Saccharibacteria bacterium]|nr:CotH kinase family protein [Candidatus Saccharibacteria bacterium]
MVKKAWLRLLLPGALILIVGIGLFAKVKVEDAATMAKFPDRGVPRINITLNGVTLDEINAGSKEVKYEGNELSLYEGSGVQEFENVRIKGRGNGTWGQEKKPYQIKLNEKVDLLGMGRAKKWYLLANAMDGTNLRTEIATYLEKMLGMEYVLDGKFVEVYVNGEYLGLYYLTHALEVGKMAVNLRDPMGVLVELDNIYGAAEDNYVTENGDLLVVKDVAVEENRHLAMNDFVKAFNELEVAVGEKDYEKIAELADVESFAKYYLLSEFSVNPDAYWTSFYFYKDGINDKIHAGPGWDFDLAFANRRWGNWMGESFYSPTRTMVRKDEILPKEMYDEMGIENGYEASIHLSKIVYDMMGVPEFQEEVKRVFREKMSGREMELAKKIKETTDEIRSVAEVDGEKWGESGFETEVVEILKWVEERYKYFEEVYGE